MHIHLVLNFRPVFPFFLVLICLSLGKLNTNYILKTDLDFFSLNCTSLEETLPGFKIAFPQAKMATSYSNTIH